MPFAVSELACDVIKELLDVVDKEPGQTIRLIPDDRGNFKFALDARRESDQVIEFEGTTIMVIESPISEDLSDAVLDAVETSEGWFFSIYRSLAP